MTRKPPQEVLDWLADAGLAGEINRPVDTLAEALPRLRRPFTPAAVKFKVQATWPGGALVVSYIDSRLVMDRLDVVVGENWTAEYEPTNSGLMWCHLAVCGVTRRDVGEGSGKGLVSDSLKRAAVLFGIGRSLYAVPKLRVYENDRGGQSTGFLKATPNGRGEEKYRLTEAGEQRARRDYEAWLKAVGEEAFGEPLDHGDAEDAQGDAEVEQPIEQPTEAQAVRQEQDRSAEQPQAPPAEEQPAAAADPDEQLAELLAKKSKLKEKREVANEGMERLGASPSQRLRELMSASTGKDLDALIARVNNAMDGASQ